MRFPRLVTALFSIAVPLAASGASPVGQFEDHADVGAPKIAGSTVYNAAAQEYTLTAGGTNMWANRDEFQFAWRKLKGDFIVRTRVEFLGPGVVAHRKVGIIARPSLDADAPYVDGAEHGDRKLTSLQFRRTKGGISEQIVLPIAGPDVLQFERRGHTYIFSAARYGEPFVSAEIKDFDLGEELHVGLFLCSHDASVKEHAIFWFPHISPDGKWIAFISYGPDVAPEDHPYYRHCYLRLMPVAGGPARIVAYVYGGQGTINVPSWSPDSRRIAFVSNTDGW